MKNITANDNKTAYNAFVCLEYMLKHNCFSLENLSIYLEETIGVSLQSETLLKYIRTFKKAGIEFNRINNKIYKITKLPFNMNFNKCDKNILQKSLEIYYTYLYGNNNLKKYKFLENLNLFLPDKLCQTSENTITTKNINQIDNNQKLSLIKKYCNDKQRLEITYLEDKKTFMNLIEPDRIITTENTIYIKAYNITLKTISMIDTNRIINIVQTPVKNKFTFDKQEVILKITSDLAKKYILKENEQIIRKSKKELVIKSFYYDKIMFFKNILRYMDTCEIIAPIPLSKEFEEYVLRILKLYNCKN